MIPERDFSSRRRPPRRRAADAALTATAGLLLAAALYAAGTAFSDARRARASVQEVRREIAAANERVRALQAATRGPGALGARAVWSVEAPPPRVVGAIAEMLPRDVRLETLTLRYGTDLEVEMTITARTAAEYDRFLRALESSPAFEGVALGNETRAGSVKASLRARYQAGS